MGKKVTDKVTWVGKTDWELQYFHGHELSTFEGSSYNAYLIRDKKNVLIDTVWGPYDREFVARLKEEIDLKDIDYIVMNHNETDHSGALMELMREIPDTPIYCTKMGETILRGQYHQDWNYVNVKTGDTLDIGDSTLTFIEARMLHWPDTMFTYMSGENILFSNDGFGQHYASEQLFDDELSDLGPVFTQAEKYYANILNPFCPMVKKKVNEILGMNLPLDLVCPSHGIIWRSHIQDIVEKYLAWADQYQEDQVTLIYDTMWNSTRKMAEAIAAGIRETLPETKVEILNAAKIDKNEITTEIFKSKAILVGSPTINNRVSHAIGGLMEMVIGLKFKGKKAASFSSFGWSGEGTKILNGMLEQGGFELVNDGYKCKWCPDEAEIEKLREYGRDFAKAL